MPLGPVQLAEVVNQWKTDSMKSMSARAPDLSFRARPRKGQALDEDQEKIGDGGQDHREDQADDDRGVVLGVEAVGDQLTKTPQADEGGDRNQADHRGGGHP